MTVTLAMVASINGLISNADLRVSDWASKEDQDHFFSLIHQSQVIIMGRSTYEASKDIIKLQPGKLRLVYTKSPQNYFDQTVPGQLEFINSEPKQLLQSLEGNPKVTNILVVGGSHISTLFLQQQLIDTIALTVEPVIFGGGQPLFQQCSGLVNLRLISSEQLNEKGTLLHIYKVIKTSN